MNSEDVNHVLQQSEQTNRVWPGLTEFGPLMWQAEADTELRLSASPAMAVGQSKLTLANLRLKYGIVNSNGSSR